MNAIPALEAQNTGYGRSDMDNRMLLFRGIAFMICGVVWLIVLVLLRMYDRGGGIPSAAIIVVGVLCLLIGGDIVRRWHHNEEDQDGA